MDKMPQLEMKSNENEAENAMLDLVNALRRTIGLHVNATASFQDREVAALDLGNEAMRRYLEEELQEMSNNYGDELLINGVLHKRSHKMKHCSYHSLCGTLNVLRNLFRPRKKRNAPTVVPLELEAGLVEQATPELAYSIALSTSNKPSRIYVEEMAAAHRLIPSRSTVERISKAVGIKAQKKAPKIERYLRQSERAPKDAIAVSVGLDRTTVPYEEERPQGVPPKTRRKKRTKPYQRQPPSPVDVNYHMAYIGTVSFWDQYSELLITRKYVATHHQGPDGIIKRMIADVRTAKRFVPKMVVGLMQDGGPEMWNLMRDALDQEPCIDSYHEAIDRYHLNERFGKVLNIIEEEQTKRETIMSEWNKDLDEDNAAIDRIERYIIDKALEVDDDDDSKKLDGHLIFIDNNRDRLHYVHLREAGLPIGSGATEGACKSIISVRAKRSGQRWHDRGVSAVLTLRAIHQSERLPFFWKHLKRCYCAKIESVKQAA